MTCFPEDVILEILSRVPAKSILRFRCVSKHWLSLTTDSSFIKLHLQRSIENNCLNLVLAASSKLILGLSIPPRTTTSRMYCLPDNSLHQEYIQIETLPYFHCSTYSEIAGCCNGLVCLIERNRGMLLNPTTRDFQYLEFHNEFKSSDVLLAYDSIMDDYKLVQFVNGNYDWHFDVDTGVCTILNKGDSKIVIHSLNDSPSLTIPDVPYYVWDTKNRGVYFDGALHWVGERIEKLFPSQHQKVIVSFDLAHKVVREFPLPDSADTISEVTLGLLQGQLSSFLNLSSSFEIWIMKIYGAGGSWYKLASIDKAVYGTTLKDARLLCVSESGGVLLNAYQNLFLYDLEQKTCKKVKIQGINGYRQTRIETAVLSYVSSCVSLQSGKSAKISQKDPAKFRCLQPLLLT